MKIYYDINEIEFDAKRAITIGSFDGVHLGHRKILATLMQHARQRQVTPFAITFAVPPKCYIDNKEYPLLTTLNEKLNWLQQLGISEVLVLEFNEEIRQMSPHSFIELYILQHIGAQLFVVGQSHSFGKYGKGNLEFLQNLAAEYQAININSFNVVGVSSANVNDTIVSSTYIRNSLQIQNIEVINQYLGYNYQLDGIVESGQHLGRTLGFPTANLLVPTQKLLPKNGVYLCEVQLEQRLVGLANIGLRPTIVQNPSANRPAVEVHIIDFDDDIYGKPITIHLQHFIRDEVKFNSQAELVKQIQQDIATAKAYYKY